MRRCLACQATFAAGPICPSCGLEPSLKGRVTLYAPDFVGAGGFNEDHFPELARLEEGNFWFRARNRLILWALRRYCPGFDSFLEIGCGTGYVLSGVARAFPSAVLHGSEIFQAGLAFAISRTPGVDFMQMDARDIPFVDEFAAIGAFDVLEHIEEDSRVLFQMHAALRPDGVLLLTVPQHDWLWSPLDDSTFHVRRYSSADLHRKVREAGFEIVRSTSFVSCLLPLMLLSRLLARVRPPRGGNGLPELEINAALNRVFELLMGLEFRFIRLGLSLPLGGSRLLVARKA